MNFHIIEEESMSDKAMEQDEEWIRCSLSLWCLFTDEENKDKNGNIRLKKSKFDSTGIEVY